MIKNGPKTNFPNDTENNEQIIQMIQLIFQVQKLNNMLLKQILNNNINDNNMPVI